MKKNQPIQEIDLGKDVFAQDYSETIFLVGRSKDCHVVLDDKKISREHLKIIHKNGKWFVEKVQPENAALVNGESFNRHELDNGDSITVEGFSINVTLSSIQENTRPATQVTKEPPRVEAVEEIQQVEQAPDKNKKSQATATDINIAVLKSSNEDATSEIDVSELSKVDVRTDDAESVHEQVEESGSSHEESFGDDLSLDPFNEKTEENSLNGNQLNESDEEVQFSEEPNDSLEPLSEEANYSLENIDTPQDDESTKIIKSFANVHLELFGETAPYDKFILDKDKIYIGRDPSKCQIVLNDSEVSTVHAVVTKNNIMLTLEDLNSSNGTLYKGDRINKVTLSHNDEFVIGGVTFTVKVRSEFLKDESQTLMAVDENQTVEVEEVVEVQAEEGEQFDALGQVVEDAPQEKSIIKRVMKDEQMRKKVIYGIVALIAAWVFLEEEEPVKAPAPKAKTAKEKEKPKKEAPPVKGQIVLSEDQRRALSAQYEIGKEHYNNGRYREALQELQKVAAVDPQFNSSLQSLIALSKEGLAKLEEKEKERVAAEQAAIRKAKVKELLEKAREYTKERQIESAQTVFNDIMTLEPENLEVPRLKRELENWQRDKEKAEQEVIRKKQEREAKVEKLKPSKSLYLQKEWFRAISKLEEFLRIKDMDEDLTTEATEMLKVSREELSSAVSPLTGKAKSLMEGQDLKGAYEVYQQILRIEPSNTEALNQMGDIKEQLSNRARKIYREAIISESLSLFQDAKEKYQEVQQISPVDSEYYKKATEKLRDYLD